MALTKSKALALAKKICKMDNLLGGIADYEGDKNGPTFIAWEEGRFKEHADAAIEFHEQAIRLWRVGLEMHKSDER